MTITTTGLLAMVFVCAAGSLGGTATGTVGDQARLRHLTASRIVDNPRQNVTPSARLDTGSLTIGRVNLGDRSTYEHPVRYRTGRRRRRRMFGWQ